MTTASPGLGMTCAWCKSADWLLGEVAVMPDFRGALFHDRAAIVPPATQNGRRPGNCYTLAVAARVA